MLKLKLQYIGCLMWRTNSLEKIPMHERFKVKEEEGGRGWDGWIASPVQWRWTWANSRRVRDREAWHAAVHGVTESWAWLRDWTTTCLKTTGLHDDVLLLSSLFYLFYLIFSAPISFSLVFQFLSVLLLFFLKALSSREEKFSYMYVCCGHSVTQWRLTLCDLMDCCMPGFPVHHHPQSLLKLMST